MKLVVQIPCFNEEKTLPLVVHSIPKKIPGVSSIEILVIDDGSSDKTVEVAKKLGVHHIIRHRQNKGLAKSFADGIHYSLMTGADIIVNTDADNQYPQKDIPKLIQPVLDGKADIVVADRQTGKIAHFSPLKKMLQRFGSGVVRELSGTAVPDAVSGFRAYSRDAALEMNIVTDFSYVIETIMSAQSKRLAITSTPIVTNPPTRPSRLFKNMFEHMRHSGATIIRIYTMYRPLSVFLLVGNLLIYTGILVGIRFAYFYIIGEGMGHIQSIIFGSILVMVGVQVIMTGLVADLIGINRKLLEDILLRLKRAQLTEKHSKSLK
jgi:glycosyltransferase involved in cell wall biosynthesis